MVGVMLAALASSAYGQGQVLLANNAATLIINRVDGQPMPLSSPVTFQLFFGVECKLVGPIIADGWSQCGLSRTDRE